MAYHVWSSFAQQLRTISVVNQCLFLSYWRRIIKSSLVQKVIKTMIYISNTDDHHTQMMAKNKHEEIWKIISIRWQFLESNN